MFDKALTLIELIIGMAITAIISSTVLVSFSLYDRKKLEIAGRNLVSDISWARELAVSRHNNYTVVFDVNNETYSFYNSSITAAANLVKKEKLTVDLINVTDWKYNTISQVAFSFPKGNATDSALITLGQTGRFRRLNISDETGFIRME